LQKIKDHVFSEKHILSDGIKRFPADLDMAEGWLRLTNGNFIQSDLTLLLHEYAESIIMQGTRVSYNDVHPIVNTLYNWHKSL